MPVYVTEYFALARDGNNHVIAAGQEPAEAEQEIDVSSTSAQSAAFGARTHLVMIHATEAAFLAFGTNPTAVDEAHAIGAGETRFYGVVPGQKVAAVTSGG